MMRDADEPFRNRMRDESRTGNLWWVHQGEGEMLYDRIGRSYATGRRTEPRIAQKIWAALGNARTVVNVGAGTGSYEPPDRVVLAVEPSAIMRSQRPLEAPACISAVAEHLPFASGSFDAAMAVLSDHHWTDPIAGLREMRRVARKVLVFQWDNTWIPRYWLVRDYLPELAVAAQRRPSLAERAEAIGAQMQSVNIPWDCVDGFFHAYWRRPEAYLDEQVRRTTSVWARLGPAVEERAIRALRRDLDTGAWHQRHGKLLTIDDIDLGARLLVT